jgi:hypothetical protein
MSISAREIVAKAFPGPLQMAAGLEVIADFRPDEAEFFAAVNETQQGVILKRIADGRLSYFSALPLAAKQFLRSLMDGRHREDIVNRIAVLDVVAARQGLTINKLGGMYDARKRWTSGVFVVLPQSNHALCVERVNVHQLPGSFAYWRHIEAEAERLGPLEL